jgi:hypothetical protein
MKRARTNEQIVEEFFMRRRVDEPLDEEWKQVVESLRDKLIAELKTGRAGPAAQLSAAKLLELLTSRREGALHIGCFRPKNMLP